MKQFKIVLNNQKKKVYQKVKMMKLKVKIIEYLMTTKVMLNIKLKIVKKKQFQIKVK